VVKVDLLALREKLEAGLPPAPDALLDLFRCSARLCTPHSVRGPEEAVFLPGSGPKPYELRKKGNVYSCTCSVWKHIDEIERRRTCKHLRTVRGERAETGRVGEDGLRKSDEKLRELLELEQKARQAAAHRPPGAGHPPPPQGAPRPAAGVAVNPASRAPTAEQQDGSRPAVNGCPPHRTEAMTYGESAGRKRPLEGGEDCNGTGKRHEA